MNQIQKQSFAESLENRCSRKFPNIHRKTPVLESLFNKVVCLNACNLIKKETPTQMFSCENCETFKNTFFYRTPLVVASEEETRKKLKPEDGIYSKANIGFISKSLRILRISKRRKYI